MKTDLNIGDRLRLFRDGLGKNQKDFAELLMITQQSLSKYERGELNIPDKVKIDLLNYDVNLTWLLTGEGEMFLAAPTVGERLAAVRNARQMDKRGWALIMSVTEEELENYETNKVEPPEEFLNRLYGNVNAGIPYILYAHGSMFVEPGTITDKKPQRTPLTVDDGFKEALPDVYALYKESRKLKELTESQSATCAICGIMEKLNSVRREKVDDFARWQLKEQEAEYSAEQANQNMAG